MFLYRKSRRCIWKTNCFSFFDFSSKQNFSIFSSDTRAPFFLLNNRKQNKNLQNAIFTALSELTVLFNVKFKISYLFTYLRKANDLRIYQQLYLSRCNAGKLQSTFLKSNVIKRNSTSHYQYFVKKIEFILNKSHELSIQ